MYLVKKNTVCFHAMENVRKKISTISWTETVALDLRLKCGPELWVSASIESGGKHTTTAGQSVWSDRTLPLRMNRVRRRESFSSSGWSSDVRTGPLTSNKRTGSAAPGHPRCETQLCTVHERQVLVIKFTPGGRHCGPPFCVQHFRHSSLDIKDVWMCTCWRQQLCKVLGRLENGTSWQISGKLASRPRLKDVVNGMIKR